jgi:hypothetical protein
MDVGLKLAVAPLGSPLTLRPTAALNPPDGDTVTVYVVVEAREIVRLAGVAEMVKSPDVTAFTTSVTVVACVVVPLVPVIVSVYVPASDELDVVMVRVEEPEPVTDVGLKLPVAPDGKPVTPRLTVPLKPPMDVMVVE